MSEANGWRPIEEGDWDDGPAWGDAVECWQCGGEGGWEDDDPFWPNDWVRCDICKGKGGWICEDPDAPGAPLPPPPEADDREGGEGG